MNTTPLPPYSWPARWMRFSGAVVSAFHRYATWLVSISWRKFLVLALVLVVAANIVQTLPPFSWSVRETVQETRATDPTTAPRQAPQRTPAAQPPTAPPPPTSPDKLPPIRIEQMRRGASEPTGMQITIDASGVRIAPKAPAGAASAASAAAPSPGSSTSSATAPEAAGSPSIAIELPPGTTREDIREAVRGAVEDARDAIHEAVQAQREALEVARQAREEAHAALQQAQQELGLSGSRAQTFERTRVVHWGDVLPDLALLWVLGSALIKFTYKGRMQAEAKAAVATEVAEAESLKRQVVEARMAAMQAQVEPHFLFNTLGSIDHLIETDPPRASQMQKNLIALLRASMPTLREAGGSGSGAGSATRDLGRELAVIRPYLEILKVRMEERLTTHIHVPEGLMSAEFPPMMVQTLVENAIKHGLEPQPEGGSLTVKAEIVHGQLAVSVADTGCGFGRAPTGGTGVGLANIRERLQLLHGPHASLAVAENTPRGTVVTITVPYRALASFKTSSTSPPQPAPEGGSA
jgi:signal transduction histidine kinase